MLAPRGDGVKAGGGGCPGTAPGGKAGVAYVPQKVPRRTESGSGPVTGTSLVSGPACHLCSRGGLRGRPACEDPRGEGVRGRDRAPALPASSANAAAARRCEASLACRVGKRDTELPKANSRAGGVKARDVGMSGVRKPDGGVCDRNSRAKVCERLCAKASRAASMPSPLHIG